MEKQVLLPCGVGDTLYFRGPQDIIEVVVTGISYSETVSGLEKWIYVMTKEDISGAYWKYSFGDVGTKLFTSKEALL